MLLNCSVCGKRYERNEKVNSTIAAAVGRDSDPICYACALERITGGHAPEEGDFNSAHFISCEISNTDLGYLMEDLRNVELGRSTFEPYENPQEELWKEMGYGDQYDDDPDTCPNCYKDINLCDCAERFGDG